MSLLQSFISKHIQAAAAHPSAKQTAVAVFFYGPPPAAANIALLARNAQTSIHQGEDAKTRVLLNWADVSTAVTIDAHWNKALQMQGMRAWTERFPKHVLTLPDVQNLIGSFDQVTACYGTVCQPGLDAGNKVFELYRAMLGAKGGFFFSRNSFYAADGIRITGYEEDPMQLCADEAMQAARTNQK